MAYTLANLEDDIRNFTEVSSSVLSTAILNTLIKKHGFLAYVANLSSELP